MTFRELAWISWPIAGLAAILMCAPGCSDDDPTSPPDDGLEPLDLTVILDLGPLDGFGSSGYVFASSPAGDVLATAAWAGRDTVVLAGDDGEYAAVTVTVVGGDGGKLQTLAPRSPVGVHAIEGERTAEEESTAWVTVQNAPPHSAFSVAANGRASYNYHTIGGPVQAGWTGPVTDAYLRLSDADGPVGAFWVRDLHDGDEPAVDLAAPGVLEPMEERSLTIPEAAAGDLVSWRVDVRYPAGTWPRLIPLESASAPEAPQEVVARLSPSIWTSNDLHTQIVVSLAEENDFTYVLDGPWPESLPTVENDVTIVAQSPDGLVWDWVDDPHRAECRWFLAGGGNPSEWITEGEGGAESRLVLPELPAEVTDALPHLVRADYVPGWLLLEREVDGSLTIRVGMVFPVPAAAE